MADAAGSLLASCPVAKDVFKLKYRQRETERDTGR